MTRFILRRGIPVHGTHKRLAAGQLVSTFGDSITGAVVPLFFLFTLGASAGGVALAMTTASLGSMAGATIGGTLSDRFGHRRVATISFAASAVAACALAVSQTYAVALVFVFIADGCLRSGKASRNAYIAHIGGPDRVLLRGYLRSVLNISYACGALAALGFTLAQAGRIPGIDGTEAFRVAIILDATTSAIAAVIYSRLPDAQIPATQNATSCPSSPQSLSAWRDYRYLASVAVLAQLVSMYELFTAALTIYLVATHGAPAWLVPVSLGLFTVISVAAQVPASRGVTSVPTATRAIRRGGGIAVIALAAIALAPTLPMTGLVAVTLIAATVLIVGDVLISAGRWELEMGLANPASQGSHQGAADTCFQAVGAALPQVTLAAAASPLVGWPVLLAVLGAATFGIGPLADRTMAAREAAEA